MNVFISWRSSERDLKNKIVERLRNELDQVDHVWESDAGCVSDFSEDCIRAIRESQVFVVLVSDNAMDQSYVTNEVVEAHECELQGKLNMVVYKLTDAPYSPKLAGHLNHISDVHHLARSSGKPDDASIDALLRRVKSLLHRRKQGNPEKPADVLIPVIEGATVGENSYFVPESRNLELRELEDALAESNVVFVSGLNGYGKKALVRQYARLHKSDYDTVLSLSFFKGSLRDFFLNGIHITNVNETVFDNLTEEQLILKKASFLKKLDPRTLIIVPDLTVGDRDNAFIMDALADLPCRILFVSHTLPTGLPKSYPVITVGRMDTVYLKELFFYHYPYANENEREQLTESLDYFIESIEGHTQSVEITATALSEELGIYPEDVPEILEKIRPDSDNELADRIFSLISDLFDLNRFNEEEKKILFAASLLAKIPMDEKTFASLLKEGGFYNAGAIRKLEKHRWLTLDRETRTVWIDSLPAEVCLSRIPMDEEVVALCVTYLSETAFHNPSPSMLAIELMQVTTVLELLKLSACLKLTSLFSASLNNSDSLAELVTPEALKDLLAEADNELALLENEDIRSACHFLVSTVYASIQSSVSLFCLSERTDNSELSETAFFRILNDDYLDALLTFCDSILEDQPLFSLFTEFVSAVLSNRLSSVVITYEKLCDSLDSSDFSYDDDPDAYAVIGALILPLGNLLLQLNSKNTYLMPTLCRSHLKATDFFGFPSYAEAYTFYHLYFNALIEAGELTEELDSAFLTAINLIEKYPNKLFADDDEAQTSFVYTVCEYARVLYQKEEYEQGNDILDRIRISGLSHASAVRRYLLDLNSLAELAVTGGDSEVAISLLEDLLPAFTPVINAVEADSDGELHTEWETLSDILCQLKNPLILTEKPVEYLDYYQQYTGEQTDKKLYHSFRNIADAAQGYDFSAFSQEALLERAQALKKAAMGGAKPDKLAPEAFALVSEAGYRILGFRHHYVQYIGGAAIASGMIAEMQNGEGKTYTILLAAFLHTLYGKQVHILDSSAYLCKRNFANMRGVLEYLGCSVGLVTRHNNHQFRDFENCDILYATLASMSFYRLKNELFCESEKRGKVRFDVVIADEADYALIENGDKPCTIIDNNHPEELSSLWIAVYNAMLKVSEDDDEYYEYNKLTYRYVIKEKLYALVEKALGVRRITLSSTQANLLERTLQTAIHTIFHQKRGIDYHVVGDAIYYEDTTTGEFYSPDPTHRYFLCRKEGISPKLTAEETKAYKNLNRSTVFDLIREYKTVSGTTATARSVSKVFQEIYRTDVISIPSNKPVIRVDHEPILLVDAETKKNAILRILQQKKETGQPVILITPSIAEANSFSAILTENGFSHTLLTAMNSEEESQLLGEAGKLGAITVTTAMANRGVDVMLGGNPFTLAQRKLMELGHSTEEINDAVYRIHDISEDCRKLREHYLSLTAYFRHYTNSEKERVEASGGLCVIGTECFKDLRVEQQVRGRAGRQGSPGESYMLFSLDDPSVSNLIGAGVERVQALWRSLNTETIDSSFLMRALARTRKKMQERYLISLTETPNLLYFKDAHELLIGTADRLQRGEITPKSLYEKHIVKNKPFIKALLAYLKDNRKAAPNSAFSCVKPYISDTESLSEAKLPAILRGAYEAVCQKFIDAGEDPDKHLVTVSSLFLQNGWTTFLQQMDNEIESANSLFSENNKKKQFLLNFATTHATYLLEHQLLRILSVSLQPKPTAPKPTTPLTVPVNRPHLKTGTGRNDPCPCGSGLKYKNCCGKPKDDGESHTA